MFLEHTVYAVEAEGRRITAVDAREARSGIERRFTAPVFIDCSGTAIVGILAGARTMFGQESHTQHGEMLAPDHGNHSHHGNTIFFRTRLADHPVAFPEVPWALDVAKDYANLSGQLEKPGTDNGPGPAAGAHRTFAPDVRRRMQLPNTHFWEYGQDLDPYTEAEHIRDHLLCAVYGTFSNVKTTEPQEYANLELDHLAFVPAQGEFHRYLGDYVLTETDIREHRSFDDAVVWNDGPFCLHYPGDENYDFRLRDWKWDTRDEQPYRIPFRCLYSADIDNLMMAGKHISVTHVAGSSTKFMGNGAQHAVATAAAAALCLKHDTSPRGIQGARMAELQDLIASITGKNLRKDA
ncbi:FAD-dependent oxidoreductase [Cumulibacter manganitolerans]|uniref:FAD-dependent oxidoreductase n=1 Tax=Cumulibacter manganitolerans TaxID=1884992 RepID=UPI00225E12E7|nr:FAD-dependent oxidoreductase [Cumulibacter manganitolerans]